MDTAIRVTHVEQGLQLEEIRMLLMEYAPSLGFNLCFQNFDKELKGLPGLYALPKGRPL
jgi:hypothetical protein